jgi:DNA-binding transcriptional LysR family regulator
MELRHLRYFVTVAETGGFGRAARLLNVAQSAISEQIRDLEGELEAELFDRSGRRIRLTKLGEGFLVDAHTALAAADRAIKNVHRSVRGEIGSITIGFFVGGIGPFFTNIIREFRQRFKGVQISLVEMAPGIQYQALIAGTIDIGFTRPLEPALITKLRFEPVQAEPIYAVFPKDHALADRKRIFIRELASERFVLNDRRYSPALFDKIITLCTESDFSPTISCTASVSSGVIALVEAGEGIALLPKGSMSLSSRQIAFVPVADEDAFVDLIIAWSTKHETAAVRAFIELARRKRKKSEGWPERAVAK